jgi:hypothetical protein
MRCASPKTLANENGILVKEVPSFFPKQCPTAANVAAQSFVDKMRAAKAAKAAKGKSASKSARSASKGKAAGKSGKGKAAGKATA